MMKQIYPLMETKSDQATYDWTTVTLSALADLASVIGQPLIQAGFLLAAVLSATVARGRVRSASASDKSQSNYDWDYEINKRRAFYAAARAARHGQLRKP